MSQAISPGTGKVYGVERVCRIWSYARSSVYARRGQSKYEALKQRPGPKPQTSDANLLALIKKDLADSPFKGEGHRKVHYRIRQLVKAGRERVLRIMRENSLLSPYRAARGAPVTHDGTITSESPNEMWGTDGARFLTVEDGLVWGFFAVDHFNSECVGWHVAKVGSRFAALQPLCMGLQSHFGSTAAGIAVGLTIRSDHGTQYTSEDFLRQVAAWRARLSYAYVAEPQTNGIVERFIRTLKEQVIHGKIHRNLEEVRQAVARFIEFYNNQWLLERLGYLTPREARLKYERSAEPARAA